MPQTRCGALPPWLTSLRICCCGFVVVVVLEDGCPAEGLRSRCGLVGLRSRAPSLFEAEGLAAPPRRQAGVLLPLELLPLELLLLALLVVVAVVQPLEVRELFG